MRRNRPRSIVALVVSLLLFAAVSVHAQSNGSTRPRRVSRQQPRTDTTQPTRTDSGLLDVEPANNSGSASARRRNTQPSPAADDTPLLNPVSSTPVAPTPGTNTSVASDTSHAFSLLQQKQYAAALKEARQLAETNPNDSEAWKIAGFAEMNLNQPEAAATDLQKALDLQRAARQEDPFTADALGHAYFLSDKFDRALPLLVAAMTRPNAKPDALTVFRRGVAEYRTGKTAEAETTFNAIVKENPKDATALFYLGQIAYERKDFDAAIAAFNRSTLNDARFVPAWDALLAAYLQRAAAQTTPEKGEADYLNAVRAGEGLMRVRPDERSSTLFGQALFGAKQYARAATVLEKVAANENAPAATLYFLGYAYVNANNFLKAIPPLERAAAKTPDVNTYLLLGYAYENVKQNSKALAAYEKGLALAPDNADLKAAVERVRPQAK
jgi:tetratricopeptide (TPR) repeat protein